MEIYRGSRGKTPLILDVGARRKRWMTYCHERWVALSFGRQTWRFAANCYFHLQGRRLWPILSPKCSVYLFTFLLMYSIIFVNRDSSVGAANRDGLDGPGIETRWGRFFAPVLSGSGTHPASCTMGTGFFLRVKSGRGVTLTPHPLLVPWSWKGRAIPLLPLWAVRPIQSLSGCTGVHFTLPQCL